MSSIFEMSFSEALAVIVLVAILLDIAHPFIREKEFVVARFLDGISLHLLADIWFQKPCQKPPDKTKAALISKASSSQLIVKCFQGKKRI